MPHTLYILTKTGQEEHDDFSTYIQQQSGQENHRTTLVFTQGGPQKTTLTSENMYIIQEDTVQNDQLNSLAYRDVLGLIFISDSIVVM
ncbi:hypothetical protein [Nitrospira sp. M1]